MIIRDYIASLREENELDALLNDLLYIKKIIPQTKITKGARQRGVDIEAIGLDERGDKRLFIVTVKQGDINRKTWDGDKNSVRQSLDQIQETHFRLLDSKLKKLPCTIIVATNGELKQNVDEDWKGYKEKHTNGSLEFEFWGLHTISDMVDENLIPHSMFSEDQMSLFRKCLALIEESEYDLYHYYKLIDTVFDVKKRTNKRETIKKLNLVNLLQNILHKWCVDTGNLKNSYLASERMILAATHFILKNENLKDKKVRTTYNKIFISRLNISYSFVEKVKDQFKIPYHLGHYSESVPYQYPIIFFEQLGIISQIGIEFGFFLQLVQDHEELTKKTIDKIGTIYGSVQNLVQNNPSANLPQFDDHLIDITIFLYFLYLLNEFELGISYLKLIIENLIDAHKYLNNFFPIFTTDYDELNSLWVKGTKSSMNSSHLFLILAEWCLCFGYLEGYNALSKWFGKNGIYENVDLHLWIPDDPFKDSYFEQYDMKTNGGTISLYELPTNYVKHIERILEENELFPSEPTSDRYKKFWFLPLLASRHFRNLPLPYLWRNNFIKNGDITKNT